MENELPSSIHRSLLAVHTMSCCFDHDSQCPVCAISSATEARFICFSASCGRAVGVIFHLHDHANRNIHRHRHREESAAMRLLPTLLVPLNVRDDYLSRCTSHLEPMLIFLGPPRDNKLDWAGCRRRMSGERSGGARVFS